MEPEECEGSLVTTFAGGEESYGIIFDVQTLRSAVSIVGMDLHIVNNTQVVYEIYTKPRSFLDDPIDDMETWTSLVKGVVMGLGEGVGTPVNFNSVSIGPDAIRSFYVTLTNPGLAYTISSETANDDELEILIGIGVGSYPLGQNAQLFRSRVWNGRLFYQLQSCLPATPVPVPGTVKPSSVVYSEREALGIFFRATGGIRWKNKEGWVQDSADVCTWFGIECDSSGSVISIVLVNNTMVGNTPPELFFLEFLERVALDNNVVDFGFQGIGTASSLRSISLSYTRTTSLDGISDAVALSGLNLGNTALSGELSREIFAVSTLASLDLGGTSLSSTIPPEIGLLTNLRAFSAQVAGFGGPIPTEISNLVQLSFLDLSSNRLSGPVPTEIANLVQLNVLNLSRNSLSGMIPQEIASMTGLQQLMLAQNKLIGPLPSFSFSTALRNIDLSSNILAGELPVDLLAAIQDKTRLVTLNLTSNSITGSIPSLLREFDMLDIYLADNRIESIPRELCGKSAWMGGDVGLYSCDAILCPPGTFTSVGRQDAVDNPCRVCSDDLDIFGSTSCRSAPTMPPVLRPSFAPTSTLAPGSLLSEEKAMELFFNVTDGPSWTDSRGWLVEGAPVCEWFGIACDRNGKVLSISLASNGLIGTTPQELFHLQSLENVRLNGNEVDFTFSGIEVAPILRTIQISDTMTKSTEGVGGAQQLTSLSLGRTLITGEAAGEIFNVKTLEVLEMGNNQINLELLPFMLDGLPNLRTFAAPSAGISGVLPNELTNLAGLKFLDLSNNRISGPLPFQMNQLESLQTLRLRSNRLEGELIGFEEQVELRDLDLSNNLLEGVVPDHLLPNVAATDWQINIDLSSNMLTGTMPETLARFERLNIDLTGNKINTIPDELCQQTEWMDGAVGLYGCSAIMCPPGSFNAIGKQNSSGTPCLACPRETSPEYYGSTSCMSLPPPPNPPVIPSESSGPAPSPRTSSPTEVEDSSETCSDGLVCENGGSCVESSFASERFYCDCTTVVGGGPHAGLRCEYPATSLCASGGPPYNAFCTNGGACISIVQPGQLHPGCRCPSGFDGAFCQFSAAGKQGDGGNDDSFPTWAIFLIAVLSAVGCCLLLVWWWWRRRSLGSGSEASGVAEGDESGKSTVEDNSGGGAGPPLDNVDESDSSHDQEAQISREVSSAVGAPKDGEIEEKVVDESQIHDDGSSTSLDAEEEKREFDTDDEELPRVYGEEVVVGEEFETSDHDQHTDSDDSSGQ